MFRLTLLLHSIVSTVLMGTGIVVALVLGYVSALAIVAAILGGIALGWPIARLIAKELYQE